MRHRNRHRYPPKCIWPNCGEYVGRWPELKLCNPHARVVHDNVARDLAEDEARRSREAHERLAAAGMLPQPEERQKRPTIYFVQVGGHIKIGWTTDLQRRMRAYPPNTQLLAAQPGTRAQEQALHRRFAVHRSHGREWYPLAPQLLEHIRAVVREHGEPEVVDFGARPVEVPQPRPKQFTKPKHWARHVS